VLLGLRLTPRPSINTTRKKSHVGLNLAIWGGGGTKQILCVLSMGREKRCQDRPWHHDGNVGVPCLVDTTCYLHTARIWTVLRSRPSSKFGGRLSVSCSPMSTVPRSWWWSFWTPTILYPKVSVLAAWSKNCKWYSSLPLGATLPLFCEPV
jgi:hypothetical protein